MGEHGGAVLGQACVSRTPPPQVKGPQSALGTAHACLPGSRSSGGASRSAAGDCRRRGGLRARPRGLQLAPPTLPAHPGAEAAPSESRQGRPHQPAATKPRIISGAPPRVRIPHPTPTPGRDPSFSSQPVQPQLRPPPHGGGGANLKTHSPHRVPIGIPRSQRQLPESSVLGQLFPSVFRSWRKSRGRETLPAKPVPLPLSAPLLLEDTQGWLPTTLAGESGTGWWRHTPLTSSRSPDIGRPWLPPALSASPDRAEHLSSRNGLSPVQLEIGD